MMPTVHGVKLNAGSTPANNVLNATVYSALTVAGTYGTNAVGCTSTSAHIKIGSATVLTATSSGVSCEPILSSNLFRLSTGGGMICTASGHALDAPGSFHYTKSYSQEQRRVPISPFRLLSDDDSNKGGFGSTVADSGSDPYTGDNPEWVAGVRMTQGGSEGYLYLPQVPEYWRATHIYIGAIDKSSSLARGTDIAVISRSHVFTGTNILTRHLKLSTGGTGTNREIAFTTPLINDGSNYGVCFLNITSNQTTITGGYLVISRI